MSIYGEFDQQFRPRPTGWRIALTALSQTFVATVIASFILAAADMFVLWRGGLRRGWLVYGVPWGRLFGIERLTPFAARVNNVRAEWAIYVAATITLLAILLYFWPFRPALATRMFGMTLVQALLLFAAWPATTAADLRLAAVVLVVAIIFAMKAEASIEDDLGNEVPMQYPGQRLLIWFFRVPLIAAALGAAAWRVAYVEGAIAAIAFAVLTFAVAIARRPPALYRRLENGELREAAVATPIFAIVLLAALVMTFGYTPPRRALVIAHGVRWMTWTEIRDAWPDWWTSVRSRVAPL
jgi:hypothetical protein